MKKETKLVAYKLTYLHELLQVTCENTRSY